METSRTETLRDLLQFSRPLAGIARDLALFGWDADAPLVALTPEHLTGVLARFLSNSLFAPDVESWANAVEAREDIEYEPASPIGLAVHELSNPLLTQPLSRQSAQDLVARLSGAPT